ncbi:hypothetical protein MtrunA17_Chr7g0222311 [Medicago truncatula]|uniref:Uncharacterized protein n=1 Tax=Medicago truncatula TaxID=3880 RepID=A0A396H0R0_MEDTR|nr:hypothetical protein MtrunA17_Chr7g0222311 [Medicago truncatula]
MERQWSRATGDDFIIWKARNNMIIRNQDAEVERRDKKGKTDGAELVECQNYYGISEVKEGINQTSANMQFLYEYSSLPFVSTCMKG